MFTRARKQQTAAGGPTCVDCGRPLVDPPAAGNDHEAALARWRTIGPDGSARNPNGSKTTRCLYCTATAGMRKWIESTPFAERAHWADPHPEIPHICPGTGTCNPCPDDDRRGPQ